MSEERIYSEDVKNAYTKIQDAFETLDIKGVTVLTGNNGSGKSLIRKQLPFLFKEKYELSDLSQTKGWVLSTSMDARTASRPEWGALSSILHDTSWVATSQNTFRSVSNLLDSIEKSEAGTHKYLVIDEYEIGCSEETILALATYISERIQKLLADGKIEGAMIITHSRLGIKHIKFDHFVNIEGKPFDEWMNREITPTDLVKLDENELFLYIRDLKNS